MTAETLMEETQRPSPVGSIALVRAPSDAERETLPKRVLLPLSGKWVWETTAATMRRNAEQATIAAFHIFTLGLLRGCARPKLFARCIDRLSPRNTLPASLPVSALIHRRELVLQREAQKIGRASC